LTITPRPFAPVVALLLQSWWSVPFLDLFVQRQATPPPTEQSLTLPAGRGTLAAYLVTPVEAAPSSPQTREPAIILASGREGLGESLRRFAREMAGVGYVALAVDYRGDSSAAGSSFLQEVMGPSNELADVAAWLAGQPSVDPGRVGALAWNDAFDAVSRLAAAGKITAAYPSRISAQAGMSEQEWVDVYEYFGKHVEDVRINQPASSSEPPIARIIDIMRAINSEQGVRGRLARALATPPSTVEQWEQARSDAAVVAEAGNILMAEKPPKGSATGWQRRATDFRQAAQRLSNAVAARDFAAAQQSLRELPQTCAACHAEYR
jgi:Cytochrome C'